VAKAGAGSLLKKTEYSCFNREFVKLNVAKKKNEVLLKSSCQRCNMNTVQRFTGWRPKLSKKSHKSRNMTLIKLIMLTHVNISCVYHVTADPEKLTFNLFSFFPSILP